MSRTFNDALAEVRPPGSGEAREAAVLAALAGRGFRTVEIRLEAGSCGVCRQTSEGGRHPITHAPTLPVRGCQRERCRCSYVGVPPPERRMP